VYDKLMRDLFPRWPLSINARLNRSSRPELQELRRLSVDLYREQCAAFREIEGVGP
jgi:hypothetical protein